MSQPDVCPKCGLRIKHQVKGDIGYLTRFTCDSVEEQDGRFVQSAICCLVEERLILAEQQLAVAQADIESLKGQIVDGDNKLTVAQKTIEEIRAIAMVFLDAPLMSSLDACSWFD